MCSSDLDLKLLPVCGGRKLNRVYIAANAPAWQKVDKRCRELGLRVEKSFNAEFDVWLREARGRWLVLACVGDDLVLPEKYRKSHSPLSMDQIRGELKKAAHGTARRTLDDGTAVILLYGRTDDDIQKAVEELPAPAEKK